MSLPKKIYGKIRKRLSPKTAGKFAKLVFYLSNKPTVRPDSIPANKKFPGAAQGGLILSADFEMSWAFRFSKRTTDYKQIGRFERENIPKIISLLETYHIPVTWATVGHLFLESCRKGDHDWMRRIPHFDDHWRFREGDWFAHDPYSDYQSDGEWYAPDLIRMIMDSPVNHEFGCHTFSHIDCTYKNCPPEVLDDELAACAQAVKKYGLVLSSFVFPGGTFGNYEILKKHHFRIYRKRIEYDLAYPFYDPFGLLISPTSGSFGDNGMGWSKEYLFRRYKKYIDKAVKTNTIAHIWFHPSVDTWTLEEVMPEVFRYAAGLRDSGKLWIGTMGEIADHISKNKVI